MYFSWVVGCYNHDMELPLYRFIAWIAVFIWAGVIFYFSSLQSVELSEDALWDFVWHKSAHLLVYAILAFLLFIAIGGADKKDFRSRWTYFVAALVISTLYAMSDEFHQSFVPTRSARLRDVFVDMIGASVGVIIAWKFIPILKMKLGR